MVAIYSLLVFQVSFSADMKHWVAGFLMLSVPVVFFVNIVFLLIYLFSGSWRFLLSLLVMVIGYPLLARTLSFKSTSSEKADFSVVSYNAMYANYGSKDTEEQKELVSFIDTLSSDILCFQEFYNKSSSKQFNFFDRLKGSYPHSTYMFEKATEGRKEGAIGLALFSKHPIIAVKEIPWKINNNGLLRCDIKVGEDTLRIFNIQLKSMGIRVQKVIQASEEERGKETRNIIALLRDGFEQRVPQVNEIELLVKNSPYPSIVAGDINELPYGYAYGRLSKLLRNSFEEAGSGFGFTYHKILGFLRIDNQFYDDTHIEAVGFKTYQHISNSDHYPIWASYKWK